MENRGSIPAGRKLCLSLVHRILAYLMAYPASLLMIMGCRTFGARIWTLISIGWVMLSVFSGAHFSIVAPEGSSHGACYDTGLVFTWKNTEIIKKYRTTRVLFQTGSGIFDCDNFQTGCEACRTACPAFTVGPSPGWGGNVIGLCSWLFLYV
jgi:hypothetical protein